MERIIYCLGGGGVVETENLIIRGRAGFGIQPLFGGWIPSQWEGWIKRAI